MQYAFPDQAIGSASAPTTITLMNGQSTALSIASIQVPAPFSETNTCGTSVAAGASCTISVTFSPTALGPATGTLAISDNGAGSPSLVALSGNGVSTGGPVTVTPTQYVFPDQAIGSASAPATITLMNGQTTALSIASVQVPAPFGQTNTCGASVAAGASCSIAVTFSPTGLGPATGTLAITDSGAGSPRLVALSGNGIQGAAGVTLMPTQFAFPNQAVGKASAPATIALTNIQT
jgi:hypothetical protein